MPISQALLPEFDQEMANTRKMLERVPEAKYDYKPHEKSMAMGRLASHVAEMALWGKTTLETEVLNIEPGMQPFMAKSKQELLETFDTNVREARQAIEKASDADWMKTWTMNFGGKQVMSMPRVAVVRGVVMNHMIHHRAQLSVYLRLNDVEVPGMYGPSADEMKFWQAQG
jgi:uncharacterized damage-inducible protein DinB